MLKKILPSTDGPDPNEEIVTVAIYPSLIEADLVRGELASAGIEAWVGNATAAQTLTTFAESGLEIQVRSDDAGRATELIHELGTAREVTDEDVEEAEERDEAAGTQYDDAEAGG